MGKYRPPSKGEFKVRPGRRVIWLARPSKMSVVMGVTGTVVIMLAVLAAGVPIVPMVWYTLKPSVTSQLAAILAKPVEIQPETAKTKIVDDWQPPIDASLPKGGWIVIKKLGVKTVIQEAESANFEEALKKGVWRVPEFGTPLKRERPMIMAAHRFGYLKWSNAYRRLNSFFNLPKLQDGDEVEVYWGQRRYVYQVYAANEGTMITDYEADLILYTCQYLESDQRIFRYAKLVKQ